MVEYRPTRCRAMALDFLKATAGTPGAIWRSMPAAWTPATAIATDQPQSIVSTALGHLRRAGAVETRRDGRVILYRPRDTVVLHVQVHRDVGWPERLRPDVEERRRG